MKFHNLNNLLDQIKNKRRLQKFTSCSTWREGNLKNFLIQLSTRTFLLIQKITFE